uniref:Ig-like domain-containing protein n=1 Tax=Sander lucioperca TaxID=283035 RepID=A0A8C9ZJJ3_SANLU
HNELLPLFNMLISQKDNVLQPKGDVTATEGEAVTLGCQYNSIPGTDYFYWYRQYPGKPLEFLIFHVGTQNAANSGLSASVSLSEDKTKIDLQISSAAVSDSAVYYCAVRPTVTGNTKTLESHTVKLQYFSSYTELLLNYRRERNFYIQQSSIHKPSTLPLFNMLSLQHCVFSLMFLSILTDSALYYCAVRPTVTANPQSLYKNTS